MGVLIDGVWTEKPHTGPSGSFEREAATLRDWVTRDGKPGPEGQAGFPAEAGRYHLYVSLACPWASRAIIFRKLKKLEDVVGLSIVSWHMGENGWTFDKNTGSTGDAINGATTLAEIYLKHDPKFTGRVTVPVLWDKQRKRIVNNESSEIIRMLNSEFDAFTDVRNDYYPEDKRAEIDRINDLVYPNINNGVYRAGFATKQEKYEDAFHKLFDALDKVEAILEKQRYLTGSEITEADWRLFTTLVRFDAVYYGHFKCNLRRIEDYPNLPNYMRELYQVPGVAETVDLKHIKNHYYGSHPNINPTGIVPLGPALDFTQPHDRARFS